MRLLIISIFISILNTVQAQSIYTSYRDQFILRSSIGYNSAPFLIKGKFNGIDEKLKYRANMNAVLGLGLSYKWFSLGFRLGLTGYVKDTASYGKTNYFDVDLDFNIKKWYCSMDLHAYEGFSLQDAIRFNDSLSSNGTPNFIKPSLRSLSLGLCTYRFFNQEFNMKAGLGVVSRYHQNIHSFYLKFSSNLYGIADNEGLLPYSFLSDTRSIIQSNNFAAFDFGVIPGFGYFKKIENWQVGGLLGVGAMIQTKFYTTDSMTRGFIGLAPRYDLRIIGGYNVENWFCMLDLQFDNKSIRFNDIGYQQNYYYIRLLMGYRFKNRD